VAPTHACAIAHDVCLPSYRCTLIALGVGLRTGGPQPAAHYTPCACSKDSAFGCSRASWESPPGYWWMYAFPAAVIILFGFAIALVCDGIQKMLARHSGI